ncbi:hypothetical protein Tcan_13694 [Toxocara canis]|uniref:Uncharacterized protein n=1 Tax=Toxocara canis TaxID=6265 RepID=A0A0B2VB01_TOXCA|nr:hypothetical protein Tcan_13694 [Toxocara canis]
MRIGDVYGELLGIWAPGTFLNMSHTFEAMCSSVECVQPHHHSALQSDEMNDDDSIGCKALHVCNLMMVACSTILLYNVCSKKKRIANPLKQTNGDDERAGKKVAADRKRRRDRTHTSEEDSETTTDIINLELINLTEEEKEARQHYKKCDQARRNANDEENDNAKRCAVKHKRANKSISSGGEPSSMTTMQSADPFTAKTPSKNSNEKNLHRDYNANMSTNETSITFNESFSKLSDGGLKPKEFIKGDKEMRIAKGQRVGKYDYKTLDDVESDWSSSRHAERTASDGFTKTSSVMKLEMIKDGQQGDTEMSAQKTQNSASCSITAKTLTTNPKAHYYVIRPKAIYNQAEKAEIA